MYINSRYRDLEHSLIEDTLVWYSIDVSTLKVQPYNMGGEHFENNIDLSKTVAVYSGDVVLDNPSHRILFNNGVFSFKKVDSGTVSFTTTRSDSVEIRYCCCGYEVTCCSLEAIIDTGDTWDLFFEVGSFVKRIGLGLRLSKKDLSILEYTSGSYKIAGSHCISVEEAYSRVGFDGKIAYRFLKGYEGYYIDADTLREIPQKELLQYTKKDLKYEGYLDHKRFHFVYESEDKLVISNKIIITRDYSGVFLNDKLLFDDAFIQMRVVSLFEDYYKVVFDGYALYIDRDTFAVDMIKVFDEECFEYINMEDFGIEISKARLLL